jgi:hypothetical protein
LSRGSQQAWFGLFAAMTKVRTISWAGAAGLAGLVVYGPFLVMALYALLFVSCSHCQKAAWTLLPWAPGLLPVAFGRRWLNLPRLADALTFALAFLVSLAMVFALASLARCGRRARWAGLAVAAATFSVAAFCLLALIRA